MIWYIVTYKPFISLDFLNAIFIGVPSARPGPGVRFGRTSASDFGHFGRAMIRDVSHNLTPYGNDPPRA